MKWLTLVYAYYENPNMLARQLREWESYEDAHKQQLEIIVVDDCSQRVPALSVVKHYNVALPLTLYRIGVDIPWNQDGARNLAMRHCQTEWALMTDMDHMLPAHQVAAVLAFEPQAGNYYMPGQHLTCGSDLGRPHPNSYLMRREDFWQAGGYDEDFAGYYGSDGNFRRCMIAAGLHEHYTSDFYLIVFRTEDIFDANTKGLGRKHSPLWAKNNKRLAAKMRGAPYKATNHIRFPYSQQYPEID